MSGVRYLFLSLLLVLAAACGSDTGNDTVGTAEPTAPATAAPTAAPTASASPPSAPPTEATAAPTPDDTSECSAAATPASHEQSARCVYEAMLDGDRDTAAAYATPEAVERVFELSGYPTDDQWSFDGCDSSHLVTTPTSDVSCNYYIPGDIHGVDVEMAMRDDFVVEAVQTIG